MSRLNLFTIILVMLCVTISTYASGPVPISADISAEKPKVGTDNTTVTISITLKPLTNKTITGKVAMRYPAYIDPTVKMATSDSYTLVLGKSKTIKRTVIIPNSIPDGIYQFPIDIYIGGWKAIAAEYRYIKGNAKEGAFDPTLRLSEVTRTSASITWKTPSAAPCTITLREAVQGRALPVYGQTPKSEMVKPNPNVKPIVLRDNTKTKFHGFTINGLKPATRYLVSITPEGDKESERLSFYTAPPKGKTMYVHLKFVNVIFTNVTNKPDADKPGADVPASAEEVERVKREIQMASMFYWINSGMRFYVENEFYVTDKYYTPDNTPYGVGFTGDDWTALKELVAAAGKKLSDYDGRNLISLEKRWDPEKQTWTFAGSGGGTYGPEGEPGYGVSCWKAGGQNYWLWVHECGHQIDALYGWSMAPEFLFNHFQPWDDTAHLHGEHFDGNAWLCREFAGYYTREHQGWPMLEPKTWFRYFTNRWGVVEVVDDKDEDGIPDKDPRVPLDEERWGSDPSKKDTDGDGLSDLYEAMACEWVDYGLGEIWAGPITKHRSNPRNPDTDGDGIKDGKDPYPIYPFKPEVRELKLTLAELKAGPKVAPFATMDDPAYKCSVYAGWDKNNFYLGIKSDNTPETARIYLDFGNNGWFVGKDNYDLRISPNGNVRVGAQWHVNAEKTFGAALHNCGEPGKWPFYDQDGLKDGEVKYEQSTDNGYAALITIPKNLGNGVLLTQGQKIGILFAVGPVGGAKRPMQTGQLTIFEPHTFFRFSLVK
jgi:hypothetical protein